MKDWIGNGNSIYTTLGASNHTEKEREANDYYATEPKATELLLAEESFCPTIWEPACGGGHMSDVLLKHGYEVISTDLVYRGYGVGGVDFLEQSEERNLDIITNPPYRYALDFIKKALSLVGEGHKVAMFLKLQFLEGKARKEFYKENPPKTVYVSSSRLNCAHGGDFEKYDHSSAVSYAWFVWVKGYKDDTVIKWIN